MKVDISFAIASQPLWLCLGLSILVNLNNLVGNLVLCLGLYTPFAISSSFPLIFLLLVSWSASFLLFPFSPKLQIDNSTVQFKHISMNYFVWGVIHHLILFSTHQLLSFFFPKLQNVNLHIQFVFDLCIFHLWVNEFIGKKGMKLGHLHLPIENDDIIINAGK